MLRIHGEQVASETSLSPSYRLSSFFFKEKMRNEAGDARDSWDFRDSRDSRAYLKRNSINDSVFSR